MIDRRVPPILHHVWPGADPFPATRAPAARFHAWRASWLAHHPDWSLRFHRCGPTGHPRLDALLADPAYTVVVKADVLRWWVLWQTGGVYADTDVECTGPLGAPWRAMLHGFDVALAYEPQPWRLGPHGWRPGGASDLPELRVLSPALVAARPRAPTLARLVDALLDAVAEAGPRAANAEPHAHCGPLAVTERLAGDRAVFPVPAAYAYPEAGPPPPHGVCSTIHHWTGGGTFEGWTRVDRTGDGTRAARRPGAPAPPATKRFRTPEGLAAHVQMLAQRAAAKGGRP